MRFEKILVLDDELIIRKTLQEFLSRKRYKVRPVATVQEAMDQLQGDHDYDLMFLDVNLPDGEGTDVLEAMQGVENAPLAIMITGQGTIQSAVRCMKLGAFDYLLKPFSNDEINIVLQKAAKFHRLVTVNQELTSETSSWGNRTIIGSSPPMKALHDLTRSVARTDATVLIGGETGTGKELISHAIHSESLRRNKPFIKVNCAAISETLIESEFFGHEKGAFTGAVQSRIGRFELADGGTLLLDEVSEISLPLQAKLLRVLQERELERVGGTKTIKVDVRIIATTNRDLLQSVKDGEFREDLYYRLNVFPLHAPALRDRKEDIPLIAASFLQEYSRKHGRKLESFSPEAMELLMRHTWPGNVRELQNIIERAVILSVSGNTIVPASLPLEFQQLVQDSEGTGIQQSTTPETVKQPVAAASNTSAKAEANIAGVAKPASGEASGLVLAGEDFSLAAVERQLILKCLQECKGNRTHASEMMQVSIRTLRNKLSQYKDEGRAEFAEFF
ncbi:MAG: sigma-54 dependent transcriptional regulator [Verrucomicrobia bacterium]|nr:sigma-54 dependent transcriptional regulator [Verrucomicrobiota bacterium]